MSEKTGLEGCGFDIHQPVIVIHERQETSGIIESAHAGGKVVDVRISHPGSKVHGRVLTYQTSEVKAAPAPAADPLKK